MAGAQKEWRNRKNPTVTASATTRNSDRFQNGSGSPIRGSSRSAGPCTGGGAGGSYQSCRGGGRWKACAPLGTCSSAMNGDKSSGSAGCGSSIDTFEKGVGTSWSTVEL